jgi:hypothetical protein
MLDDHTGRRAKGAPDRENAAKTTLAAAKTTLTAGKTTLIAGKTILITAKTTLIAAETTLITGKTTSGPAQDSMSTRPISIVCGSITVTSPWAS